MLSSYKMHRIRMAPEPKSKTTMKMIQLVAVVLVPSAFFVFDAFHYGLFYGLDKE